MIEFFFTCLLQQPLLMDPDFFMNMGFLKSLLKAIHKDFAENKRLHWLVDDILPHNNEGIKYKDLVKYAYKYPPLLYPIIDFQRVWRRKIFGETVWGIKLSAMHDPVENEEA